MVLWIGMDGIRKLSAIPAEQTSTADIEIQKRIKTEQVSFASYVIAAFTCWRYMYMGGYLLNRINGNNIQYKYKRR
jgi:hypothetical protein